MGYGPVVYGFERHWHLLHVCSQDEVFFPPASSKLEGLEEEKE